MQGIARNVAKHGWHLNLEAALSGRLPRRWSGDGILTTLSRDIPFEQFQKRAGCPAVSLSLNRPQIQIPRVGFDNRIAGHLAAEHFLERGFGSFAFYHRHHQYSGQQRFAAFTERIRQAGFDTVANWDQIDQPDQRDHWAGRQELLTQWLSAADRPVGVFAADDAAGVEVIEACQSLGLSIPYEVGVLGMLDIPLFRQSTTVAMSSITVDFAASTRIACDVLAKLMEGGDRPSEPILLAPTGIAVRESTDTIAAGDPHVARAIRFMMEHYGDPIDVGRIVAASGLGQTQLYAAFKQYVGQSPAALLTRIRIDKAKRSLADSKTKIEAIAHACGFGDRINLYRQFKQHEGISPGAYRRHARSPFD